MKGRNRLSKTAVYPLVNILVTLILIFTLCPTIIVQASTQMPSTIQTEQQEVRQPPQLITPSPTSEPAPTPMPSPIPLKVTATVNPDEDSEIKSPSGKVTLIIPKGAVSAPVNIELIEKAPGDSTGMQIVNLFDLNASDASSGSAITQFNKDLQIIIRHNSDELAGLDTDSLRLYYLDEKTLQWLPVPSSKYDTQTMTLTATTNHFSHYGEQANPIINEPGRVMAAQVDLHSGTAIFGYPIELPPGPGGFRPKLELTYNSGTADEMKNKRSVGSWVGIGWILHLGRISYDKMTNQYFLDLNGASYELISTDSTNYRTNPDQYFKITRSGNTWEMRDREGVYYRFGGTTDSQQYLDISPADYYRWDLSLLRDTNNNEATISYVRDIWANCVRSAYPEYLNYGNVQVHFTSSYDEDDPTFGHLRKDDPKPYGSTNIPKVMDSRKLDNIEIKVSGTLIRKYTFAYNTTDRVFSYDYGGIYYSGKHSLTSITQVGADGTSSLPAMSFTYEDKQIFRQDSGNPTYNGNPGNPASLSWPHLTVVNSGYGGSISFSYTQIPDTSARNIWTREVVTAKTINSGIGSNQSYTYTYTGNPQYLGSGWEQQYRGFGEVKETDAANNYAKHFFYTTGKISNKDAERLTGKEYKTEWYSSTNALLRQLVYDWSYTITSQQTAGNYITSWNSWIYQGNPNYFYNPKGVAVYMGGYIYVADYSTQAQQSRIVVFDSNGNYITSWNSWNGGYYFYNPKGIAVSMDGYVYVADYSTQAQQSRIVKFDSNGNYVTSWNSWNSTYFYNPQGVAVSMDGYVYVADYSTQAQQSRIIKFDSNGNYVTSWNSWSGTYFYNPKGVAVSRDGYVYVADYSTQAQQSRIVVFDSSGNYVTSWNSWTYQGNPAYFYNPQGIAATMDGYVYVADYSTQVQQSRIVKFTGIPTMPWAIRLNQVDEVIGSKTSRTRYLYDSYGNVVTSYLDGDISTNADDSTIWRAFYPNTTANILSKPARERVYATIVTQDNGGSNLKKETLYYYDGNNTSYTTPPTKGNLTRLEQKKDASNSISTYYTYDTYGNKLTEQDPNSNTTTWTYETTHHTYPATKTYPITGLSESYSYEAGTTNLLSQTDVNSQTTTYEYDAFKRLTKVIKPGDSSGSPSIQYQYNNWGTINQQHIKTITKIDASNTLWQSQYFDGLGRVVQVQAQGETGHTIIPSTTAYSNRGLVDKQYVSQDIASSLSAYQSPDAGWKYVAYAYDGLGRVTTQTNADGTTIGHDYSTAWQDLVTNERGYKKRYYYDASQRLVKVEELNASHQVYATTNYSYDVLSNLTQVKDNSNNTTSMTYNWLSRKTAMTDPDMGSWSYGYDSNGNLTSQTDAKSKTITMTYDALNRLTGKTYPAGSGMINVTYTYDSTTGGNYGKGKRTGMTDALGTTSYKYDTRGRLIEEKRTVDSVNYTTQFAYDGADRPTTITYPTGEVVTDGYNGRGLPYSVSGSTAGNLATSALYNGLGQVTEINFNNGLRTTFGYYQLGGTYDTTGGYYGRLWEIKTLPQGGGTAIQDVKHTWDAGGNLATRENVLAAETETFGYDFLNRLTSVSGPYSQSYTYNQIGNITSITTDGTSRSYTYSTKPHAVTGITNPTTSYAYDNNGNMTTRGAQTITWDVENRPVSVTGGASFVYDGDGNRGKKTENSETILYINRYYEKNLTTGEVTTSYYLGDKLVAQRRGTTLSYIHQDSLTSTSVTSDSSGASTSSMVFYPFGNLRSSSGTIPTDKKFTGQRLDATGLYYYGARYYDPTIGRFISADTVVPKPFNPQELNRYTYCLNNPLRYVDPTGHQEEPNRLSPPTEDGQLGWTVKDGWLISQNGKWIPIISPEYPIPSQTLISMQPYIPSLIEFYSQGTKQLKEFIRSTDIGRNIDDFLTGLMPYMEAAAFAIGMTLPGPKGSGTVHGLERLSQRGFTEYDYLLTKTTNVIKTQADGAKVFIREVSPGKFNVVVEGDRGVITGLKNIDQKALNNLAKNYGWK